MVSYKNILIIVLALTAVNICTAAKNKDITEVVTGDWEYNSQVQKIADTPLGALYNIEQSNIIPYLHYPDCNCSYCKDDVKVGGLLQFSFLKNNEKNKRFVVIDFTIRASPAFENEAWPAMRFMLMRSADSKVNGNIKDFNGMLEFKTDKLFMLYTPYPSKNMPCYDTNVATGDYRPDFEPLFIRVIFDTHTGQNLTVYYNQQKNIYLNAEVPPGKIEFRNVGISILNNGTQHYRDRYLEISRPVVRQFDTEKEMDEKLEAIQFRPYQYGDLLTGYLAKNKDIKWIIRQAKQDKNPDVLYACAKTLLYGKDDIRDPETAVDLLKESATKNNHVLAKYDLALCYYRGYGVEKDEKAAFRYIRSALKFRYDNAAALYIMMRFDQLNRPIFLLSDVMDDFKEAILSVSQSYAVAATINNFSTGTNGGGCTVATSPKCLNWKENYFNINFPDKNKDPYSFFDASIAKGYYPTYYLKAQRVNFYEEKYPSGTSVAELLEQGTQKGDPDAAIGRLFLRAQNKQLTADDFSQKQLLWLQNYPEFYLLQFIYQHPDTPAAKEIAKGDYDAAETILSKDKQANSIYLSGLMTISKIQYLTSRPWLKPDSAKFKRLINAAKTDYPAAKYFLARAYYYNDMPNDYQKTMAEESRLYQATQFLRQAADADFLPAQYMLLQVELDTTTVGTDQYLQRVQKFCDLDYTPAFLLKAQALQKFKHLEEAKRVYREAATKGNVDAYYELSLITKDNKELWSQYIDADQKRRTYDKMDFYYPQIEYFVWVANITQRVFSDELLKELQDDYKSVRKKMDDSLKEGKKNSKSNSNTSNKDNNKDKKVIKTPGVPQKQQPFMK